MDNSEILARAENWLKSQPEALGNAGMLIRDLAQALRAKDGLLERATRERRELAERLEKATALRRE